MLFVNLRMSGKGYDISYYNSRAVTVTTCCDWMNYWKAIGTHFNVTGCRTIYVL